MKREGFLKLFGNLNLVGNMRCRCKHGSCILEILIMKRRVKLKRMLEEEEESIVLLLRN